MTNYLNKAKEARNDEFYTKYEDVAAELKHWQHKLAGKNIICPCDSEESAFVRFLNDVKEEWSIKSITSSCLPVSMFDVDYSKYDICITNPPFSRFTDVLNCLIGKIDFIILGPWLGACSNKTCRTNLQQHKLFGGFGKRLPLAFTNTDKKVACSGYTSFDDANISDRIYDCDDGTLYNISVIHHISTYDYDFCTEQCDPPAGFAKKKTFNIYLRKKFTEK